MKYPILIILLLFSSRSEVRLPGNRERTLPVSGCRPPQPVEFGRRLGKRDLLFRKMFFLSSETILGQKSDGRGRGMGLWGRQVLDNETHHPEGRHEKVQERIRYVVSLSSR